MTHLKIEKPLLNKYPHNPIIAPNEQNHWESHQTFNPGAISINNTTHIIYRAIGDDGVSRLGYACSNDGLTISERLQNPIFEHTHINQQANVYSYLSGGSIGGCEDPRLVRVDDENKIYMTYTACDGGLRVGLTSISIDDFIHHRWNWSTPKLISPKGQVHKNWLIFPEKIHGKYAILHSIKPTIQIAYVNNLDIKTSFSTIRSAYYGAPQKKCWDIWLRGAGTPPLKTPDGWLVLYHAMDNDWGTYKVGAFLLDLENPTKICYRSKEPVLIPDQPYELSGFKPRIVYTTGATIQDNILRVYYGCSDSYVGVASANLDDFLKKIKEN